MSNATQVLDKIAADLEKGPFKVRRNVTLSNGKIADITASRTYFSWKGLVILSQHIVIQHIDNATKKDAEMLFKTGFLYGKKANWIPLLRGMQFGFMVIPVIVGESPDAPLVETVTKRPPKHWSLFEFPVLINLSTNQTLCYRETALWGAFFFSDMRKVVDTYIKGSLPSE